VLPGDSFNDVAIFDGGPSPANAETMTPAVLCGITREDFEGIMHRHQKVALNATQVLARRVRHFLQSVEALSFRRVVSRIAKLLLEYAGDGTGPRPRLTQQEMAAVAGTAREVVGRSLKTLQEEGAIRMERHRIVIVDREALNQIATSGA